MRQPAPAPEVERRGPAPGPRGWPLLGNLLERERDPLGILVRSQRRYGDVVALRSGANQVLLVNHPRDVKHVLVDRADNYPKNEGEGSLTGLGLFGSEGELWKRQRALVQPAFHRERLGAMVAPVVDETRALLDRWASRGAEPFDAADALSVHALELMARLVCSEGLSAEVRAAMQLHVHYLNHPRHALVDLLFRRVLPRPLARRLSSRVVPYRQAVALLDGWARGLVQARRALPVEGWPGDVLTTLLQGRDAAGEGMTETQARDELLTLIVGGHEATAVALTWTLYLLDRHHAVAQRVRAEVAAVLGERAPTVEDLHGLRYVGQVFQEAMRLYPPAWMFSRIAQAPDQVGGYDVAPGTMVSIVPYLLHRHPEVWEAPEMFDPDRFLPERTAKRHKFAYLPFGGGQRLCIGNNLALIQATLVLAMTVQRFRVTVHAEEPLAIHTALTLRPRDGLRVTLAPAR